MLDCYTEDSINSASEIGKYLALNDETILDIYYVNDITFEKYCNYKGYCIKTNYQIIYFLIESVELCCETFGVDFYKEDNTRKKWDYDVIEDLSFFINKKLKEISFKSSSNDGDIIYRLNIDDNFFNIKVYNYHNGYYSHLTYIKYGSYFEKDPL